MHSQKDEQYKQQPMDPRMLQAMYGGAVAEDEIDLLAYWNVIWKRKWLIIAVSFIAAVLASGYALSKPNIYRAEALLAPVGDGGSEGGGLSSMLGGLSGLASMAGVSLGGGGSVEQNLAVLKSRSFIWGFVDDEKLMPILFADDWDDEAKQWIENDEEDQPSLWDAWRLFNEEGLLSAAIDKDTGLVTIGIEWEDAELATLWVTKLVERLNAHLRKQAILQSTKKLSYLQQELAKTQVEEHRKILYELISTEQKQAMLANTQQEFAFRVIDAAFVPDKKIKPKRAIIVMISAFVAGFLCVIFVFIREGMELRQEEMGVH